MASMTSNVKLDLRFDISKLKYPGELVYMCMLLLTAICMASEAMGASI